MEEGGDWSWRVAGRWDRNDNPDTVIQLVLRWGQGRRAQETQRLLLSNSSCIIHFNILHQWCSHHIIIKRSFRVFQLPEHTIPHRGPAPPMPLTPYGWYPAWYTYWTYLFLYLSLPLHFELLECRTYTLWTYIHPVAHIALDAQLSLQLFKKVMWCWMCWKMYHASAIRQALS